MRTRTKKPLTLQGDLSSMMSPIVEKETKAINKVKVDSFLEVLCYKQSLFDGVLVMLRKLMVVSKKPYSANDIVSFAMVELTPGAYYNYKETRSLVDKVKRCLMQVVNNKLALNTTDLVYDNKNETFYTSSKVKIHRLIKLLTEEEKQLAISALEDLQDEESAKPFSARERRRT